MNTEKGIGHYKGWFQTKQGKPARVLLDIKSRGLVHAHALAVRDWVLGFWRAIKLIRYLRAIAQVINREKFKDGIHENNISSGTLNEKNMLHNLFHTQHLTITPPRAGLFDIKQVLYFCLKV